MSSKLPFSISLSAIHPKFPSSCEVELGFPGTHVQTLLAFGDAFANEMKPNDRLARSGRPGYQCGTAAPEALFDHFVEPGNPGVYTF